MPTQKDNRRNAVFSRKAVFHPSHFILQCFLALQFLFLSCENELPFDPKANPPKLVMNALLNADSLHNTLFLNLTGREHPTHIQGASVEVRVNGELKETLRPLPLPTETQSNTEFAPQCKFGITTPFAPGDLVRIDAFTDDGQHHAWAEVTVPQRLPEIAHIDTLTVPLMRYGLTRDYLRYRITFHDIPHERNYYRLVMDKRTSMKAPHPETRERISLTVHGYDFIPREDIVLTDGHPSTGEDEENGMFDTVENVYGVFDDSRFENSPYTMTVYNLPDPTVPFDHVSDIRVETVVRLLSITETEFYYLKALNLTDSDAFDEAINEPIKYPSNVHGGTGIVGICTEVSRTIHIVR